MVPRLRGIGRLSTCLWAVSLSLAALYLCTYEALGQTPPGYGGGGPTVYFADSSMTVDEGDIAYITVVFYGNKQLTAYVDYATSDGTGHANVDYMPTNGTLTGPPAEVGSSPAYFNVYTMNNPNNTLYVAVNLTLSDPTNTSLGDPSTMTLYIVNPSTCGD